MYDEELSEIDAPWFLTNLPADEAGRVRQAAQETGFRVVVSDDATNIHGNPVPGYIAVRMYEPQGRDHEPFWTAYRALKEQAQATVSPTPPAAEAMDDAARATEPQLVAGSRASIAYAWWQFVDELIHAGDGIWGCATWRMRFCRWAHRLDG